MKYVAEWFGFMALVVGLCGCAGVQQAQKEQADARLAMQEHEHPPRKANESSTEATVVVPGWVVASLGTMGPGSDIHSETQGKTAEALAKSQTNAKVSESIGEGIGVAGTAVAAWSTGVPGLAVTGGGKAFADLCKLFHGETDLVKVHYWHQGPVSRAEIVAVGYLDGYPFARSAILSANATAEEMDKWAQTVDSLLADLAAYMDHARAAGMKKSAAKTAPQPAAPEKSMWERITGK